MKITFEFKNVKWFPATENNQRLLKKFTFNVSAVSDKSAKTPTAERVGMSWFSRNWRGPFFVKEDSARRAGIFKA